MVISTSIYYREDPLVKIVVDREGLLIMIKAAYAAITHSNVWNVGDEYDVEITPYHEMLASLKEQYEKFYGEVPQLGYR